MAGTRLGMGVMVMVASFGRSDAPVDQAATCDLKEASESGFRPTCSISTRPGTGTGMAVIPSRKVCGSLFRRARSPKMVNIGVTFAMVFTRPAACWQRDVLAKYTKRRQLNGRTIIFGGSDYFVFVFSSWPDTYGIHRSTCGKTTRSTVRATIGFRGRSDCIVFIISNWPSRNGTRLSTF
jgi:hypothetical protein